MRFRAKHSWCTIAVVSADSPNPLDELKRLDRAIELTKEFTALRPIFVRIDELSREYSDDLEVQIAVSDVKQRLIDRGKELKQAQGLGPQPTSAKPTRPQHVPSAFQAPPAEMATTPTTRQDTVPPYPAEQAPPQQAPPQQTLPQQAGMPFPPPAVDPTTHVTGSIPSGWPLSVRMPLRRATSLPWVTCRRRAARFLPRESRPPGLPSGRW